MNYYATPSGFLGTGASLIADLALLAYLLLIIPGILAGWYFAKRGKHRPQHKWVMIWITVANWFFIIFLMIVAYSYDVVENIGSKPDNFRYLMPTIHAIFGAPAQILATITIINMLREDRMVAAAKARGERNLGKYWWKQAKPVMRITTYLWLITSFFGVLSYLIRYDVLTVPSLSGAIVEPMATEEPEPLVTEEAASPGATEEAEPVETEEAVETPEPVETEEMDDPVMTEEADDSEPMTTEEAQIAPATTEEADDDSGQGRGRGRGGDDDDEEEDDD